MKQLYRRYVYWKSIDREIEHMPKECKECGAVTANPPKVKLHVWEEPDGNWQRVHVYCAGLFQGYYFLVLMDAKLKWAEIEITSSSPSSTSTMDIHGYPEIICADNATIFSSREFQQFCKERGILQKIIAPNGMFKPLSTGLNQ